MGLTMVYESVLLNRCHLGETLHRWVEKLWSTWFCVLVLGWDLLMGARSVSSWANVCLLRCYAYLGKLCEDNQTTKNSVRNTT